jgi:arsenate reductase
MLKVIFACVQNAGRSQMAAAFFNAIADPTWARATSAGTQPAAEVHEAVIVAMREIGIDLSGKTPKLLTAEVAGGADLLVTMGCGESCPAIPGLRTEDWPFPDPAHAGPAEVRAIRDAIRRRVADLVEREVGRQPR